MSFGPPEPHSLRSRTGIGSANGGAGHVRGPTGAGADAAHFVVVEVEGREQDSIGKVLRLLGRGLSNREIATELIVAPATAKSHVGRVLAKLGLTSTR